MLKFITILIGLIIFLIIHRKILLKTYSRNAFKLNLNELHNLVEVSNTHRHTHTHIYIIIYIIYGLTENII